MGVRTFGPAGRYVRQDLLMRAELADVHRAHDRVLDRPVTLALIRRLPQDAAARDRLADEVAAWARLEHPSLQRMWDADVRANKPFVVTEFVDGAKLGELVAAGSLTGEQLARVALGVASALDVVHEAGLVHGSVSADAIVVRRDGTAKLSGFALNRLAAHAGNEAPAPGTPADDVFALGAVLSQAVASVADTGTLGLRWDDLLVALGTDAEYRPTARETAAVLRSIVPREEPTVVLMPREPGAHLGRRRRPIRTLAAVGAAAAVLVMAFDGWRTATDDPGASGPQVVQAEVEPPPAHAPVPTEAADTSTSSPQTPATAARDTATSTQGAASSTQLTRSEIRQYLKGQKSPSKGKGH